MPTPLLLPKAVARDVNMFVRENRQFLASLSGQALAADAAAFKSAIGQPGKQADLGAISASVMDGIFQRLPAALLENASLPLIDFSTMKPIHAAAQLGQSLATLAVGAIALINCGSLSDKFATSVLQTAFGDNKASKVLRDTLNPQTAFPQIVLPGGVNLPDAAKLDQLIFWGELRNYLETLAICGSVARQEKASWEISTPIGKVNAIDPPRCCSGQTIGISYEGLGAMPPAADREIVLILPMRNAIYPYRLRENHPKMFEPGNWNGGAGTISLVVPPGIFTGNIGFFDIPASQGQGGECEAGSLVRAASGVQQAMGNLAGAQGIMIGQSIVNAAMVAEGVRLAGAASLQPAAEQADHNNRLRAGPPAIDLFTAIGNDPIFPECSVTLKWSVANAETIEIFQRGVANSVNTPVLPTIGPIQDADGQVIVQVPVTNRWEAEYVMRVGNSNGCNSQPVESVVRLRSGYSRWRNGVAMHKITYARQGMAMQGFADEEQICSGEIDLDLFARAFIIQENKPVAAKPAHIAMVICDLWGIGQKLKNAVIAKLNQRPIGLKYDEKTFVLAGTHTHAGTGGYNEYFMYNMTGGGFDSNHFNFLVDQIAHAVDWAEQAMKPGNILVSEGALARCGANRSIEAHWANTDAHPTDQSEWTDPKMLLLRFENFPSDRTDSASKLIGALNWFAIHPTSLGMFNDMISGDNKGWAANLLERRLLDETKARVVCGFANAAAGDVSGNITFDASGKPTVTVPMGKMTQSDPGLLALFTADHARMMEIAKQQSDFAHGLLTTAYEELTGPLVVQHANIDFSNVEIAGGNGARTWPAAFGIAFGAGSMEDSIARTSLGKNLMVKSHIFEGFTTADRVVGIAELAVFLPLLVGVVTSTAIGTGLIAASIGSGAIFAALGLVSALIGGLLALEPLSIVISAGMIRLLDRHEKVTFEASSNGMAAALDFVLDLIPPHGRAVLTSTIGTICFPKKLANAKDASRQPIPWDFTATSMRGFEFGHAPKPIMLSPGLAVLAGPKNSSGSRTETACPLVPNVIPLQLIRIGQLALCAVPAEFTATAGRRLKESVTARFGGGVSQCAIFGFANAYSGYVTTNKEYDMQYYEGASTLYGPHTLAAYLQCFQQLADAAVNPAISLSTKKTFPAGGCFEPPAIAVKY